MNIELKKKIKTAKYVSFDIFDTAILRLVKRPTDIFSIVSELYNKVGFNYIKVRVQAEKNARLYLCNESNQEISLKDIYDYVTDLIYNKEISKQLYEAEKIIEKNFAVRNPFIYDIYKYCIEKGKKVIFISDMYLEQEVIECILKREGYLDYKNLYLSSKIGKTKSSGDLFKFVLNDVGCLPNELLHIGDNESSDNIIPSRLGINTFYYPQPEQARKYDFEHKKINIYEKNASICESIYYGLINRRYYSNPYIKSNDFWFDLGYSVFGMASYGFVQWILDRLKSDNSEVVCFLARDGYLSHKLISNILSDNETGYRTKYIYMSRRALRFAQLKDTLNDKNLSYIFENAVGLKVKDVFNRVNLNEDNYIDVIKNYGFLSFDHIISTSEEIDKLMEIFKKGSAEREILENAVKERENLIGYLNQEEILKAKNIALVDIGWNGNMQKDFVDLISDLGEFNVKGYYFSTFQTARNKLDAGYLLEGYYLNAGVPFENSSIISKSVTLLESIYTAPHGSLKRFEKLDDKFIPIFEEFSLSELELSNIMRIHEGIISFVLDFHRINRNLGFISFDKEFALSVLKRLFEFPTKKEASLLGDLTHFDLGHVINLAKPLPWYKYILNPTNGFRHFKKSAWKQAYICRLVGRWVLDKHIKNTLRLIKSIKNKI